MSETETKGISSCDNICWIIGGLLGFAAFLITKVRLEMSTIIALVIGLVITVIVSVILRKIFCGEIASAGSTPRVAAKSTAAVEGASKAADSGAQSATITSTSEADAAKAAATKPAPAEKTAAPARKPVAADGRPEALDGPRDSGADNLKQIKGVGPKMEQLLNSLGFYHFDQIAGWRAKEVKWVDENLQGFKGRVSRDEWVKQAKVLAKGGVTEFSKKVKKGGVY